MKFKYTLEALTVIAIVAFCVIFLYTSSTMSGAEFAGSDNVGSGLIAELSGTPLENFQPLIPQWEPPSGEIESCLVCTSGCSRRVFWSGEYSGSGWVRRRKHNQY